VSAATPRSAATIGPSPGVRRLILGCIGVFFAIPLLSMVEFTLRDGLSGGHTFSHWAALFDPAAASRYPALITGLGNSLLLAVVTVLIVLVVLLPTMILVELQFPQLRGVLELICITPIVVPAIVLVVGLAPVYSVVSSIAGSSVWTLAFAYGITVLPYAYRTLQAAIGTVDVSTLSEAARSLGASWPTVLFHVLVPNLRRGMLAASFISVAVVLGEFTIASLLSRNNLQTALLVISKSDAYVAVIWALLSLAFVFALLLALGVMGTTGRPGRRKAGLGHE
jgi:putative spermidine/putrescine transport system permease protein